MFQQQTRPITQDDRDRITSGFSVSADTVVSSLQPLWVYPFIAVLLCPCIWLMWGLEWIPLFIVLMCLMPGWDYLKAHWKRHKQRRRKERELQALNAVLDQTTEVTVTEVASDRVVFVYGDGCEVYLFDIGEGRTYWIDTFRIEGDTNTRKWPNKQFTVFEVPGSDTIFGPFTSGQRIIPLAEVALDDMPEDLFSGSQVIDEPLDQILQACRFASST